MSTVLKVDKDPDSREGNCHQPHGWSLHLILDVFGIHSQRDFTEISREEQKGPRILGSPGQDGAGDVRGWPTAVRKPYTADISKPVLCLLPGVEKEGQAYMEDWWVCLSQ